jgi:hypothetical protein
MRGKGCLARDRLADCPIANPLGVWQVPNHNLEEKLWNFPHLSAQGNSPFAANPCALVSRLACGASYPQAESYPQRKVQVLLNS